jgi:hypothetical protein
MEIIWNLDAPVVEMDAPGLIEINASLANIGVVLVRIPSVLEHAPDTTDRPSPASYPDTGEMSVGEGIVQARCAHVRGGRHVQGSRDTVGAATL